MSNKEAKARIRINKLLEESGWHFFDNKKGKANISLEHRTQKLDGIKTNDDLGPDFQKAPDGFIDYLLLNHQQKPVAIIEAKRESIDPLNGKDQARQYARSLGVRHIFLSNGNVHYYWDLEEGNPTVISHLLSLAQLGEAIKWKPDPSKMQEQVIDENYIAISQDHQWLSYDAVQKKEISKNKEIRLLRDYQQMAIKKLQKDFSNGKRRFLFEMATGTGKTLTSAAIIKMYIRSENAHRVLFLVDRLELEIQAFNDISKYLKNDAIQIAIYKNTREDWQTADVVVSTIQSLSYENRYLKKFSPNDFQFIISDEAHRTISGNNRAIFEYFIGSKLGLTATPKDYLKGLENEDLEGNDPRKLEKRLLLDTYRTFGCENGIPTYRFSLEDAVKHDPPYLCMPRLLDARTEITTDLLSKEGWTYKFPNEDGDEEEDTFYKKDFMKRFFSRETNLSFVRCFLERAKRDPISGEIGKTIFFCVSRHHCTIITQMLNEEAARQFPAQYGRSSDFAIQITSDIMGSQNRTLQFKNNNLNGSSSFNSELKDYLSSKTRVCVTVGMMTTGYDCPDLLNVVLGRPIFSPTDYIQIKGRGTRRSLFQYSDGKGIIIEKEKDNFFLFDFFANHEYFEDSFPYDEKIPLPVITEAKNKTGLNEGINKKELHYTGNDHLDKIEEKDFGPNNIPRYDKEMFSRSFEEKTKETVLSEPNLQEALKNEDWKQLEHFVQKNIFNKPKEFWNLDTLLDAYDVDRRATVGEILMQVFIPEYQIKTRTELANESFDRFMSDTQIDGTVYNEVKNLFTSYLLFDDIRQMFNENQLGGLATDMRISIQDLKKMGRANIDTTLNYIKDNVQINQFLPR
jgi:type I restriction enzyme R subunit